MYHNRHYRAVVQASVFVLSCTLSAVWRIIWFVSSLPYLTPPLPPHMHTHTHTSCNTLSLPIMLRGYLSILFYLLDLFVYPLQYLGSLIVKRLHGQQSAEEACQKLRVSKPLLGCHGMCGCGQSHPLFWSFLLNHQAQKCWECYSTVYCSLIVSSQ